MLVIQQVVPHTGRELWDSLDPNDEKQALEAVKDKVKPKRA
jgi:hypothetical protein